MSEKLEIQNTKELNTLQKIRALMGYVENGTEVCVTLFQDDSTKDYFIKAKSLGKELWSESDSNFERLIDHAYEKYAEKFDE